MDQLYKLWPTVETHLTVHVGVMQDNRRTIWTIKLAALNLLKVNRHHKPRQVLKVHIWNNRREQWHNKGKEKQPVGLRAYDTIQWAAHHCEYSVSVIPSTVLGQQTWSCYGWHAPMLQNTIIAILHACWVIHIIKLYCMFHMSSGMYSYNKRVIMSLY